MYKYFIPLILVFAACNETYKADYEVKTELSLIDTLNMRLLTVKSWLDYMPLEEIQERKEIVFNNYDFVDSKYKEKNISADPETSALMDEYKNYGKLYRRAVDSFKPIVMEMEELLIQLKTLKESAHSKDYEKETFLKYFHKEKSGRGKTLWIRGNGLKTP